MLDKLKKNNESVGNKVDVSGGKISGNLNIEGTLKNNNKTLLDLTYPVGSIYMSIKNTNPSSLFGGTWTAWGSGRVAVGVNTSDDDFKTVEKTGGSKTHSHGNTGSTALTVAQMPSHSHKPSSDADYRFTLNQKLSSASTGRVNIQTASSGYYAMTGNRNASDNMGSVDSISEAANTTSTGSGSGHTHTTSSGSSLQPYITCYMWKRTA